MRQQKYTNLDKEFFLARVAVLRAEGMKLREACVRLRLSHASVIRWEQEQGAPPKEKKPMGRKPVWIVEEEDRHRLRWLHHRCGSTPLTLEYFCEWRENGLCPLPVPLKDMRQCAALASPPLPELAAKLRALIKTGGRWDNRVPLTVKQACRLTRQERAASRGKKAANAEGFKRRRDLTVKITNEATGLAEIVDLLPGWGFCSDDMSINQPFRHEGGIGRQTLSTVDVKTLRWLTVSGVGRSGDSYNAVDIANHFAAVIHECGLPRFWQLERGPWDNNFINGVPVPDGWGEEPDQRWGGLEICCAHEPLFRICRKFNPQGKVIEGCYNYVQTLMAGRAMDVGRRRGVNEAVSRLIQRAKNGCASALRFIWSQGEAIDCLWRQMRRFNARAKHRRPLGQNVYISPDDLWREGFIKRPLPEDQAWRLLPEKRTATVTQQSVFISPKIGGSFQFRVSGADLPWGSLPNGYRLFVAMHPNEPHRHAVLASAETRRDWNPDRIPFGKIMGLAPWVPASPMEDLTGTGEYDHQRKAAKPARTSLRAGGIDEQGLVRIEQTSDGRGNLNIVSNRPLPDAPRAIQSRHKPARSIIDLMSSDEPASPSRIDREPAATVTSDAWANIS